MNLKTMEKGIVSGMLLGDGHLQKTQRRLRLSHTTPQRSYLKLKLSLLEQLGYSVRLFKESRVQTNLGDYSYCTGTATGPRLAEYYRYDFEDFLDALNPLGLLLWWLDDGCLSVNTKESGSVSRFGYLNTQGYSLEENRLIVSLLNDRFDIETTIHKDSKSGFAKKDHYRIYINASNLRRLIDLVREFIPWIPKSIYYKLNMQYVINRNLDSPYLVANYNF